MSFGFLAMAAAVTVAGVLPAEASVTATIPLNLDGYGAFGHECCDCSLSHHVELRLAPDGSSVEMFWETDTYMTNKRRRLRGFLDNMFSPPRRDRWYEEPLR
jgi:hypothetical protein